MECKIKKNIFCAFLFILFAYSTGIDSTSEVSFKPIDYKLEIFTKKEHFEDGDESKMEFDGKVTVNFELQKPANFTKEFQIILNTNPSGKVRNASLTGINSSNANGVKTKCDLSSSSAKEKLTFNCKKEDSEFQRFNLVVNYSNPFGNDMTGFYRSSYVDSSNKTRWILTTHFEPIFARKAFPCFDQPHLKAKFEVYLTVPKTIKTVLSNTPRDDSATFSENDLVTYKFKKNDIPMSTYLLAFTASNFFKTDTKEFTSNYKSEKKRNLTTYGREEIIKAKDGEFAQRVGLEALEGLTKYLGIGYALDKVDQVGIPDFSAGAMENWGHISFREKALFFNEKSGTTNTKQSNLLTITHELVHQWFGNLVTLESWDYIWLNEAFATYIEYVIASKFQNTNDWDLMKQMVVNEIHQKAFETDGLASSKPLNNKITDENLIFASFNDIPYSKGAAVLRMWDLALKDNGFQKSLQNYLNERKEKSANPLDLYMSFKNIGKMDEKFFKTWTEQAGYPVVEVIKNNATYTLNQSRFDWEETNATSTTWLIPITYTTNSLKNFSTVPSLWLNKDPIKINITCKWIIVNNQQAGYYRVNYDVENWKELSKALMENNYSDINELNRAQILNDVFSLARSLQKNYVKYSIALDLAKYLTNEKSFVVWKTALNAFDFLLMKLNDNGKFKDFVLNLVKPHFKGLNANTSIHVDKLMNIEIARLSCSLGHEPCVTQAKEMYKKSTYNQYPDTQGIVLCTAVKNVKEAWAEVFEKYKKEQDSSLKLMYISALGCTEDKTLIEQFLNKTISGSSEIRKQDLIYVLSSVYNGNIKNIQMAFNFVNNHYEKIAKNYGGINPLGRAVVGIAKMLNTEKQAEELRKLVETIKKNPVGKPALESLENAIKIANSNVKWVSKKKEQFTGYFNAGSYLSYSFGLILLCLMSVLRF